MGISRKWCNNYECHGNWQRVFQCFSIYLTYPMLCDDFYFPKNMGQCVQLHLFATIECNTLYTHTVTNLRCIPLRIHVLATLRWHLWFCYPLVYQYSQSFCYVLAHVCWTFANYWSIIPRHADLARLYCGPNALRRSDALWRWGSRSTLVRVMVGYLRASSHYLN